MNPMPAPGASLAEMVDWLAAHDDAVADGTAAPLTETQLLDLGWGDPLDPGVKWNNDLWATASARYAAAARGDVIVLLPQDGADWTRDFGTVELPGLLADTAVDTINGISRDSLVRAWENTRSDALANGFTPDEARQHALLAVFDDRRSQGSARVRVPGG
ncbi:hypothetical protein J1G43_18320 [Cellulomonas sp. zg-ZUI22]|uniref:hypothetical protein n=1 Tax=Cellulomonas sp. zg-ZUI22 TaxID=2816955 RepID=UPI001A940008|nr:hypothetical protein [Cellulomonas sp. zg-ZUI22]MBO0901920.1 hypothetical protein [Cellulomonas sp. zg-ZUI22]